MTNENLKEVLNDYKNLNLDEIIQQYKSACNAVEDIERMKENTNKIKIDWESKLISIATDILSNIKLYDNYENEVTVVIQYNDIEKRWEIELY